MERLPCSADLLPTKDEWRFVSTILGGLYVMMAGTWLLQLLLVDNLDCHLEVSKATLEYSSQYQSVSRQ